MLNQTHILNGDMLKYKGDIMSIKSWIADKLGGSVTEIIGSVKDTVDEFHLSGEEKQQFELKMREVDLDFKKLGMEMEESYMKDRQSARDMYMKDSSLQKIFALVFLIGYILLSISMVIIVFGFFGVGVGSNMEPFQASLISMVFTAMSVKINTITDFLFGGSKGKDDSDKRLAESFAQNKADK